MARIFRGRVRFCQSPNIESAPPSMQSGIVSASGMARELRRRGVPGAWRAKAVLAMLDRLPELRAIYD